jgi:hypothetical protein
MLIYNREGTIGRLNQNLPSRLTVHLQLVGCPATEVTADTIVLMSQPASH